MNGESVQQFRNFDLITDAINAKPVDDRYLNEFKTLLDNDFEKSSAIMCVVLITRKQ